MTVRTYASPEAFKEALEQHPRTAAQTGSASPASGSSWCSTVSCATARSDLRVGDAICRDGVRRSARLATLAAVTTAAKAFLDPVLAGDFDATWGPDA